MRPDQLINQIEYSISAMSPKNDHHAFEHLCFHLTRLKICSNVKPATGPVSGGGDQGKDFNFYEVDLQREYLPDVSVLGLGYIGKEEARFSCSLEKTYKPKIKKDIKKILNKDKAVKKIYYFSSRDIKISEQHGLEEWAKKDHEVRLIIFDKNAIATKLAETDCHWICNRYLSIPDSIYPIEVGDDDKKYLELKNKWGSKIPDPINFEGFYEIKKVARVTITDPKFHKHLDFWLKKIEVYVSEKKCPFRLNTIYEYICLTMRGYRSLNGLEKLIMEYLSLSIQVYDHREWDRAIIVLNYCYGAFLSGQTSLKKKFIEDWLSKFDKKILEELKDSDMSDSRKARLLAMKINLAGGDINKVMDIWDELLKIIPNAPDFPLETWLDGMQGILYEIFEKHPKFDYTLEKLEELFVERKSSYDIGSYARDKAIRFYNKGEVIRALNELHKTKIKWYKHETIKGHIITLLLISDWYNEIGLCYAAKNYAMAAGFAAMRANKAEVKKYIPTAIQKIADSEYAQGHYINYLYLIDLYLKSVPEFRSDIENFSETPEYQKIVVYPSWILLFANKLYPKLVPSILKIIKKWGWIGETIEEVYKKTKKDHKLDWENIEKQVWYRPFSDTGTRKKHSWLQLGVEWTVEWDNQYKDNILAEEFISIAQIILCECSKQDFYLLRANVQIHINKNFYRKTCLIYDDDPKSESVRSWKLLVSEETNYQKRIDNYLLRLLEILDDISLRSRKKIHDLIEKMYKEGLLSKLCSTNTYPVLYNDFYKKKIFQEFDLGSLTLPIEKDFKLRCVSQFNWNSDLISEYKKSEEEKHILNRYKNSLKPIKLSLEKWKKDNNFRKLINSLHKKGWKDWHILMALNVLVVNKRVHKIMQAKPLTNQEQLDLFNNLSLKEETADDFYVGVEYFSENDLDFQRKMNLVASLNTIGLEFHQKINPIIDSVEDFMKKRYRYWDDDLTGQNIFTI